MKSDFYESLDKAFESASFENIENIRKVSQEKKVGVLEMNGTLNQLGMNREEEAEVLFSRTHKKLKKGRRRPATS